MVIRELKWPPKQDTPNLTSFLSFLSLVQQRGQRDDVNTIKCEKRREKGNVCVCVFQLVGCWELENKATETRKREREVGAVWEAGPGPSPGLGAISLTLGKFFSPLFFPLGPEYFVKIKGIVFKD